MKMRLGSASPKGRLLSLGIGLALIVTLLFPAPHRHAAAATGPNIVLILTDDQRWDTLWAMPNVQADLVAHGINFTNGFVVNSLCCPSRTSILTGQYSHTTKVYSNAGLYGGFSSFHGDSSTIATWLHDAGYDTGLIGKYLNEYKVTYVPPGWDKWVAFKGANGSYYNYDLNIDGTVTHYGSHEEEYSTDVLKAQADSFIRSAPTEQPLFLYFAPFAPHAPAIAANAYKKTFKGLRPFRPPSFNEADVSDKPTWVQQLPLFTQPQVRAIDQERRKTYQSLLSVDDAVHTIVTALSDTGRLSDTLIVFASDNGLADGEHRWIRKKGPYEEQIRVPIVVRYDPLITSARTDDHYVTNIDFAPTFAAAAGVASPDVEGLNMMPLISDPSYPWRQDFLIEHLASSDVTMYCALRSTEGYLYVTYSTAEEELYDLNLDPYQLVNVASDPAYASTVASLRIRLQTLCNPPPPGFTFPYDVLPPSQPTSLTGTAPSPVEVDLSWLPSTDNVAVTGYTIYRDGATVATVDGATLSYADTALEPGTTYTYSVDAFDAAGNHSVVSDPFVIATPADTEAPTQPTGLGGTAPQPSEIDLYWSASTDNVAVTGYTIYRDGAFLATVDGATLTYVDDPVKPGTTYTYTVDAFDAAGNHSAVSDPFVITP
jgi:N-acetylglucosamine-6-sulfatase